MSHRFDAKTRSSSGTLYINTLKNVHSLALDTNKLGSLFRTSTGISFGSAPPSSFGTGISHRAKMIGQAMNCSSPMHEIVRTTPSNSGDAAHAAPRSAISAHSSADSTSAILYHVDHMRAPPRPFIAKCLVRAMSCATRSICSLACSVLWATTSPTPHNSPPVAHCVGI